MSRQHRMCISIDVFLGCDVKQPQESKKPWCDMSTSKPNKSKAFQGRVS